MANFMQLLMQEAERFKRNLKAAPGQVADQVSNFKEDWKGKDLNKAIKQEQLEPEQLRAAIEEAAGNAIPGGGGAAGIFGGAGRQDLVLSRGMDLTSLVNRLINSKDYLKKLNFKEQDYLEKLMRVNGRKPSQTYAKEAPTLRAPSLAIHPSDKANSFSDGGVTLVMRPEKFDPANTARSKLYNRDVYTKRSNQRNFFGREWHGKPAILDPRMTENMSFTAASMDEWMQGLASPQFKSFAEYEASRAGAGTLDTYHSITSSSKHASREAFKDALKRDLKRNEAILDVPAHKLWTLSSDDFLKNLNFYKEYAEQGSFGKTSQRVVKTASEMPAEYAELKYSGNVPLDAEHLLGIILNTKGNSSAHLQKALSSGFQGVPVISQPITGNADQYVLDMLAEVIGKAK